MTEHVSVMELMVGHEDDLLPPDIGCEVVGDAIEEIRQAVLDNSRFVEQYRTLWNPKSQLDFVTVIDGMFEGELLRRQSTHGRGLIDLSKRLLFLARHLTSGGSPAPTEAEQLRPATVLATGRRMCIDIPTSPIEFSIDIWPFWLESIRARSLDDFPSFDQIREEAQTLLSAASLVRARIANSARQVQTILEPSAPEELELQNWQHNLLREAVKFIETTITRISRSLQTIQLSMSQSTPWLTQLSVVVSKLTGSVGFRQIGARLSATLAQRFRVGQFEIRRSDLAMLLGAHRNAFNSAIHAMKLEGVLVSSGIGEDQVLWTMPVVCLVADSLSVVTPEIPPQVAVHEDSVGPSDSLEKRAESSDSQSATGTAHASGIGNPSPNDSGSIATGRKSSIETQSVALADLDHTRLIAFSNAKSTSGQRRAIEFILAAGGSVPLKDLAVHMDWRGGFKDAWNGLRRRINQSIQQHNKLSERKRAGVAKVSQGIAQCDSRATIIPLELIRQRKKRSSKRKTPSSRMSKK